jgi:hypothetical protein
MLSLEAAVCILAPAVATLTFAARCPRIRTTYAFLAPNPRVVLLAAADPRDIVALLRSLTACHTTDDLIEHLVRVFDVHLPDADEIVRYEQWIETAPTQIEAYACTVVLSAALYATRVATRAHLPH